MIAAPRLYERVDALWHLDEGRTLFVGPLDYNASHQHGAPVYLAGLYGPFGIRLAGCRWQTCLTAVIPAGVRHELDIGGNPLAVFYLEPSIAGAHALMPFVRDTREVGGALIGRRGEVSPFRALYEDDASTQWAGAALTDLLAFARRRAPKTIDPRVSRVIGRLSVDRGLTPVAQMAATVGLSASHFQHVFSREVGVPFRRYRAWQRMRAAIREIVAGRSFTAAAYAAGFADQAHFAHDFRRTFGAPASRSLSRVRAAVPGGNRARSDQQP